MMRARRKQHTQRDLQFEGNLAFANERLQVLQNQKDKTLSLVPRPASAMTEGYLEEDALAPAIGIISAFGLSALLWGLILLGISWMW
jgi:hypothetical protein